MISTHLNKLRHTVASVVTSADISIWEILGGASGLVDLIGPHLLFLTAYLITGDFVLATGLALTASLALVIVRLARCQAIRQALGGAALVALSGLIATTTGHEADFYLVQVLRSLALAALLLVSLAVRRPLVGLIVGPVIGRPSWRKDPDLLRAYWRCTALWAVIAVCRTTIKVPLYLNNNVVGLGLAHLVTGLPLFAAMIYWQLRILRRAYTSSPAPKEQEQ